jgi:hypothetical protein
VSAAEAGKTCPYCRFPLKAGSAAERCDGCGTVHHEECWRDGNGCAVHGCVNAGRFVPEAAAAASSQTTIGAPAAMSYMPPTSASNGNRNLIIGLVGGLLVAGVGVGAFVLARGTSSPGPPQSSPPAVTTVQTVTQSSTASSATTRRRAQSAAERRVAQKLVSIIAYSQQGRVAVRSGRYSDAIANRQSTLDQLSAVTGGSLRVQRARATLQSAIEASLESDQAYASGGDASSSDARATQMKRIFVGQFNPIALKYGLPTFRPDDI